MKIANYDSDGGAGAAHGAVIGTAIFSVIGTIIGGAVAAIAARAYLNSRDGNPPSSEPPQSLLRVTARDEISLCSNIAGRS